MTLSTADQNAAIFAIGFPAGTAPEDCARMVARCVIHAVGCPKGSEEYVYWMKDAQQWLEWGAQDSNS